MNAAEVVGVSLNHEFLVYRLVESKTAAAVERLILSNYYAFSKRCIVVELKEKDDDGEIQV